MVGKHGGDLVRNEVNMGVDIELPGWQGYLLKVVVDLVENTWKLERSAGKAWSVGLLLLLLRRLGGESEAQRDNAVVFLQGCRSGSGTGGGGCGGCCWGCRIGFGCG